MRAGLVRLSRVASNSPLVANKLININILEQEPRGRQQEHDQPPAPPYAVDPNEVNGWLTVTPLLSLNHSSKTLGRIRVDGWWSGDGKNGYLERTSALVDNSTRLR